MPDPNVVKTTSLTGIPNYKLPPKFRRIAKREAKRLVKRMKWKHEAEGRAVAQLPPYVGMASVHPVKNEAGWMLGVMMEDRDNPGVTTELKSIASNSGCRSLHQAKEECEGAMIRCIFNDILREEAKRAESENRSEREGGQGSSD